MLLNFMAILESFLLHNSIVSPTSTNFKLKLVKGLNCLVYLLSRAGRWRWGEMIEEEERGEIRNVR